MDTVSDSNFEQNLSTYLDQVASEGTLLAVTRQQGEPVVIMSQQNFQAYEAAFHRISGRSNAHRVDRATDERQARQERRQALIED